MTGRQVDVRVEGRDRPEGAVTVSFFQHRDIGAFHASAALRPSAEVPGHGTALDAPEDRLVAFAAREIVGTVERAEARVGSLRSLLDAARRDGRPAEEVEALEWALGYAQGHAPAAGVP